MAQESRLVIVIDSQNAERNARNLGNELESIERKGEFASKSMDSLSVATESFSWTHGWFINSRFSHFKDGYIYWTTKPP